MQASFPSNLEYVPILWSNAFSKTRVWVQHVDDAISRGSKHLLAFNEPDIRSKANMSPQAATDAYMTYMQPFAGKVKLGGPAVRRRWYECKSNFANR